MRTIRTPWAAFASFVERHRAATAWISAGLIILNLFLLCVTPRMSLPIFVTLSVLCAWLTVIHLVTGRFPRIGWLNFGVWLVLRLQGREGDYPKWSLLLAKILFAVSILFAVVGGLYGTGMILYLPMPHLWM